MFILFFKTLGQMYDDHPKDMLAEDSLAHREP